MIGRKQIGQLLLLFFAVLMGHNLVPHHHHNELLPFRAADQCPLQHADHHEQGTHPAHCHAFNQVVYNKAETTDLQKDTEKDLIQSGPVSDRTADRTVTSAEMQFIPWKYFIPADALAGTDSSRAPPHFC